MLTVSRRLFLAEARVLIARLVWTFDIELAEPNSKETATWLRQRAWLVCEPKAIKAKLYEAR